MAVLYAADPAASCSRHAPITLCVDPAPAAYPSSAWCVDHGGHPQPSLNHWPGSGIGSTFLALLLQRDVVLYDVERRWLDIAYANARRIQHAAGVFAGRATIRRHDARLAWPDRADHILCSPPYGCAMGTTPTAKRRLPITSSCCQGTRWHQMVARPTWGAWGAYTFHYGRSEGQVGHYRGARYWQAMTQIYEQAHLALRPGGKLMLVIKDHVENGRHVPTADSTEALCTRLGFRTVARHRRRVWPLSFWQRRRKEQGRLVIEVEDVLVFTRPSTAHRIGEA